MCINQVVPLLREPVDVAVGPQHRFAGRRTLRAAEVVDEEWVAAPPGYPLDRLLRLVSVKAGRPARVLHRSVHFPLMERLVATEHAVALLPRYVTALLTHAGAPHPARRCRSGTPHRGTGTPGQGRPPCGARGAGTIARRGGGDRIAN